MPVQMIIHFVSYIYYFDETILKKPLMHLQFIFINWSY